MNISIVIPVYNSEETLIPLAERLEQVLPDLARYYELILVNDGSRDHSLNVITDLVNRYPWVRGVDLMRNYGQHNAILCGVRMARYEVIVTMDDDLQHPPEEIHKLLSYLSEGYDVVYGTPQHEQHGLWRDLASQVTKLVLKGAMGAQTARKVSSFRVFRRDVRDAFALYQGPFLALDVLLTWGTTRFGSVPVQHAPRQHGSSNYTLRKLITHAVNLLTGFSALPLQFASMIGFVFTVFGIIVFLYVIARYFIQGSVVPGFPFLASIVAIFAGAQLFALGIIGEYLARMHFRMMDQPVYTVRQILQAKNGTGGRNNTHHTTVHRASGLDG
jgi:undecaprenyl-phosphate 4-deoxy-4-formamido-L-arabinose transferase